jgi:O-antigen/teichoic acid export membrane protein
MIEPQGEITREAQVTARNISAVLLLKTVQYPFLVLSAMVIPRVMGPHAYGEYALMLSIVVMTASATELGIGQICGRFVPSLELLGDLRPLQRFATGLLAAKLALDALLAGPLYLLLWATYGDRFPATYFVLAISTLVVLDLGMVPYGLMFGLNRLNLYALRDPLRRALNLVLVLVFYHYFGLYGALASTLMVEASLTALNLAWGRRFFRLQDFRLDLAFLKPYLQFGFVFYLSMGVKTVWEKVGNPLIAYLTADAREVALFDIPNQMFLITIAFLLVTIGYLVPIFMRLLVTGREEKLVIWSGLLLKYIFALSTLTVGVFLITGPDLIPVLIGRNYAGVYPNAVVLLLGIFPMAVVQLGYVFCVVYREAWKYLQALLCALIAFVPAAFVLVPYLASMGAALAMLFSTAAAAVVLAVSFWDWVAPCLQEGVQVVVLGIVFVPFWFLRRDLRSDLLLAALAGGLYLAMLLFTRRLRTEEISEVLRAVRLRPEAPMPAFDTRAGEG